ncbi:hypothetical protein NKI48_33845 [Mesorhizobium sp. M0644]|uniref:hypothetical protein n=1 Tax=Mesorhizobium sp. M0644 TaxID=2956979 RepID=UPI00333B0997
MILGSCDISFSEIKIILDRLVADRKDNLSFFHGGFFSWADKAALADAVVSPFGTPPEFRLIEPDLVGVGRAKETTLFKALTVGVGGYDQMPYGGPYASGDDLRAIETWINAGMPD